MKRRSHGGRPSLISIICFTYNVHISGSSKNGDRVDSDGQPITFSLRGREVKVEQVMIFRVICSKEEADNPSGVAGGS